MLDDQLFVNLARKTGYPSREQLLRCRAIQIEWSKQGNTISLLEVCFAQGALTDPQFQRFERWAAQIARADKGPITDTVGSSEPGAQGPRVIQDSAADLQGYKPRCDRCQRELEELGVIEGKVHETKDGKKVCHACFNATPLRTPSAPRAPVAPPLGFSAGKKKNVVAKLLDSSAELVRKSSEQLKAMVRRSPRREKAKAPAEPAPEPASILLPLGGVAAVVVLACVGVWLWKGSPSSTPPRIAKRPKAPTPAPGPRPPGPTPAPGPAAVPVPGPGPAPAPGPGPAPGPAPAPLPSTPPVGPSTDPEPGPETDAPAGPTDLEKLEANASFKEAKDLYSRAELLYKNNFAGKTPEQKQGLRDSRKLLEKARGLLDKVPQELGDAATVFDGVSAKINSLLHDVEKRQGATGS